MSTCLFVFSSFIFDSQTLFHRFRNKVWHLQATFFIIICMTFTTQFIWIGTLSVYSWLHWCGIFFKYFCSFLFFPGASEARDSLSDILRGVFKFTSSRQRYGADGRYQFPHLFSVRLQIFLSLHLELGSAAAIFLSWLWALGKCCENDDVLSDVAGEQWASWYQCTIMTK